jgi:hypothetical protein
LLRLFRLLAIDKEAEGFQDLSGYWLLSLMIYIDATVLWGGEGCWVH